MLPNLDNSKDLATQFLAILDRLTTAPKVRDKRGTCREITDFHWVFPMVPGAVFFTTEQSPADDVRYVAAQMSWYAKAEQRLHGIDKYRPKMWERVTQDFKVGHDISRGGQHWIATEEDKARWDFDLHSNYGEYVFREEQLDTCIKRLHKDPMSRQAVILFNRPAVQVSDTKDHICTTSMQFLIRDGMLHAITTMRSNELWNGFRYDVAFFTFLMDYVRAELNFLGRTGITLGNYTHNVGSLHVYDEVQNPVVAMAKVFPQLHPGEGRALIRELPHIEEMGLKIRKVTNPSKGLQVLCDAAERDWPHYHKIVDLLLNS